MGVKPIHAEASFPLLNVAKLYPEDAKYKLNPDKHVNHYN